MAASQKKSQGAHTDFKYALKSELHTRVTATVKTRAGPSWDERIDKAMKGFQAKARATEGEMTNNLREAIDKGRSRKTSCPIRSSADSPNQLAMLEQRKKKMHELESEYREQLDNLRDKMEKREPLFKLSEVNAAFAMQRERMQERKREMKQDEHERWEHMKSLEKSAASRPLLIEDAHYKPPKKTPTASQSTSALARAGECSISKSASFGDRIEYEKDTKIQQAIMKPSFKNSEWGKEVAAIKERADNRQKLHEITYPNKGDGYALTRNRLMHAFCA